MKLVASLLILLMLFMVFAPAASAAIEGRGGLMGFISGCCFGIRSGGAYNDGKDLHWREWCMLIPVVGLVVAIMNGMDGMNGITTADLAQTYGSQYY